MKVELRMSERWNGKWLGSKIRLEWSTYWVKGWVRNWKNAWGNYRWENQSVFAMRWITWRTPLSETKVTYNFLISAIDSCSNWLLALIICSKVWITLYIVHKHIVISILAIISITFAQACLLYLLAYVSLEPFYTML